MKPSSRLICTAQGNFADACLAVHNYNQKHESKWLYIFQKRGIFLFFFFLLSQAACSQGLVVSVWWCNAVTVLLQSSRKASATVFRPTLTSYKDTYTTQRQQYGHHCLSGPLRGDELKGGERKCHVLVMKYRTVLDAGAGTDPKPTDLTACEPRIPLGVCEERASKCACEGSYIWMCRLCALYIFTIHWLLCSRALSVFSSTKCVHFLSHSWDQLAVLRNSTPFQQPAARPAPLSSSPIETLKETGGKVTWFLKATYYLHIVAELHTLITVVEVQMCVKNKRDSTSL